MTYIDSIKHVRSLRDFTHRVLKSHCEEQWLWPSPYWQMGEEMEQGWSLGGPDGAWT